jgi:16S rRNA (adenine1518-N6/adenine1519-N6)-dimethyltransferase
MNIVRYLIAIISNNGMNVRAKKGLGQHFLTDHNIARKIVRSLQAEQDATIIEIGPGTGMLTRYLLEREGITLHLVEIDRESVDYLTRAYPQMKDHIHQVDFLDFDLTVFSPGPLAIIGNFPYYISSQILFRILDYRQEVREVVGMLQKEVAERIASPPGTRDYGILSVLLQAYYTIEYLFTVSEKVFYPPPRVKSAVIRLERNKITRLPCDEELFFRVVKSAFNQRRKMMRNSLKEYFPAHLPEGPLLGKRPEQLSVAEFVEITFLCSNQGRRHA